CACLLSLPVEHASDCSKVPNVPANEEVAPIPTGSVSLRYVIEALQVARVGERVVVHDLHGVVMRQQPADEVRPNEASSPRHPYAARAKGHDWAPSYAGRSSRSPR